MGNFQQKSTRVPTTGAAFEVKITEEKPCSPPPKRFSRECKRQPTSVEALLEKQQIAQNRREKVQAEKLDRIRPKRLDLVKEKRNARLCRSGRKLQEKLQKAEDRRNRVQEEKVNRVRPRRHETIKAMMENRRTRSAQRLQEKQEKALERREKFRAEKLERVQKTSEECQKMAVSLRVLAQQDAKRRGERGTENVPSLTRKQATKMIEQVATGFKNLNSEFQKEMSIAKN